MSPKMPSHKASTAPAQKPQPSQEQYSALLAFAQKEGRTWKDALRNCWLKAGYPGHKDTGLLQQVRNQFGPKWLASVTYADLETGAGTHGRSGEAEKAPAAEKTAFKHPVTAQLRLATLAGRASGASLLQDSRFAYLDEATLDAPHLETESMASGAQEALAAAPQGLESLAEFTPKPRMGTLWWNADNLDEARQWEADLLQRGVEKVEMKPDADSERVRVFITLDRARADEIMGYPVEDEEWLVPEDRPQVGTSRAMTYGEGQAIKILAAERVGMSVSCLDNAKYLLEGKATHPIMLAEIEREATRIHNLVAKDPALLEQANEHARAIAEKYFGVPPALSDFAREAQEKFLDGFPKEITDKYPIAKPAYEASKYLGPAIKTTVRAVVVQHFEVRSEPDGATLSVHRSPKGREAFDSAVLAAERRGLPWHVSGGADYFNPETSERWSHHII